MEFVQSINSYALKYLPDLTFYIDLDPKTGIDRVKKNRLHKTDRLDMEVQTFHQKVREGYIRISEMFKERIVVIDGNQSIDAIYQIIMDNILKRL